MSDFSAYKQQLLTLEHDLEARRARLDQHGRDGVPADFAEQATARENDEVVESLGRQANEELVLVRAALGRIERGTYGSCARCGESIASARLAAVPYATTCAGCA